MFRTTEKNSKYSQGQKYVNISEASQVHFGANSCRTTYLYINTLVRVLICASRLHGIHKRKIRNLDGQVWYPCYE